MEGVRAKRKTSFDTENARPNFEKPVESSKSDWESGVCEKCRQSTNYSRWIQCNDCPCWYHCNCVRIYDESIIRNYYCPKCCARQGKLLRNGEYTLKRITNDYRHDTTETIVGKNQNQIQIGTSKFIENLKKRSEENRFSKPIEGRDIFIVENGYDLKKHLTKNGFYAPVVVKRKEGLGMKVPKNFSLPDLERHLTPMFLIDVVNVHKQETQAMTLREFIELIDFSEIPYDCISLEVSTTNLSTEIEPPFAVRNYSWAEEAFEHRLLKKYRPELDKFCLISMADSYTDFQIELSGSSTWYHVLKGRKKFFFVKPTQENLAVYKNLETKDAKNLAIFFPDAIKDKTYEIELREGECILIPTGYIRAMLTCEQSLLFGGNFLQSLQADLQIEIFEMEEELKMNESNQYTNFKLTHWLAIPKVLCELEKTLAVLTKENCESNPRYASLYRSFRSFLQYMLNYHSELRRSKKASLSSPGGLSKEELEEWEVTFSDKYLNSLSKIKQILDNIGFEQPVLRIGGVRHLRCKFTDTKQEIPSRRRGRPRKLEKRREFENSDEIVDVVGVSDEEVNIPTDAPADTSSDTPRDAPTDTPTDTPMDTSEVDSSVKMEASNVDFVQISSSSDSNSSATSSNDNGITDPLQSSDVASNPAVQEDDADALASESSGQNQQRVADRNDDNQDFSSSSVPLLGLGLNYELEYRSILDQSANRASTSSVSVKPEIECITIDD